MAWGAALAAGVLATATAAAGCKGKKEEAESELGAAVAAALAGAMATAAKAVEPWPCAALEEAPTPPVALRLEGWKLDGLALVPTGNAGAAAAQAVGFVGDAGGGEASTVVQLRRAAAAFAKGKVGLVVSLGGMGGEAEAIAAGLRALAADGLVVVALPGDLEPLGEHRKAVARLQQEDLAVVDGSVVRWLKLGTATIATLPGARHAGQLVAGTEGCAFDDAAVEATLSRLADGGGIKVLASWAAPRAGASSSANGDLALRLALERGHIDLAVAGEPARGEGPADRSGRAGGAMRVVTTGFSDGEPRMPESGKQRQATALVVKLGRAEWQIERIDLSMQPPQ